MLSHHPVLSLWAVGMGVDVQLERELVSEDICVLSAATTPTWVGTPSISKTDSR